MSARALSAIVIGLMLPSVASADTEPPVITHVRVKQAILKQDVKIRARINDESEIFAPAVYVRSVGDKQYDNLAMTRVDNGYEAIIPAEKVTQGLEYFIEAFDEHGNGPTREGGPDDPILIKVFEKPPVVVPPPPPPPDIAKVPPPPPPPKKLVPPKKKKKKEKDGGIASKWWFWTIIGVAVVGGSFGVFCGTGNCKSRPPDTVDVTILGPDPTSGL